MAAALRRHVLPLVADGRIRPKMFQSLPLAEARARINCWRAARSSASWCCIPEGIDNNRRPP